MQWTSVCVSRSAVYPSSHRGMRNGDGAAAVTMQQYVVAVAQAEAIGRTDCPGSSAKAVCSIFRPLATSPSAVTPAATARTFKYGAGAQRTDTGAMRAS
jgi:hypothetical protein